MDSNKVIRILLMKTRILEWGMGQRLMKERLSML